MDHKESEYNDYWDRRELEEEDPCDRYDEQKDEEHRIEKEKLDKKTKM